MQMEKILFVWELGVKIDLMVHNQSIWWRSVDLKNKSGKGKISSQRASGKSMFTKKILEGISIEKPVLQEKMYVILLNI